MTSCQISYTNQNDLFSIMATSEISFSYDPFKMTGLFFIQSVLYRSVFSCQSGLESNGNERVLSLQESKTGTSSVCFVSYSGHSLRRDVLFSTGVQFYGPSRPFRKNIYISTPLLGQDMTQGQFLSGV